MKKTYSYKVRAIDAEGDWSRYSLVDSTTTYRYYVCGDANRDGNVNIGDAVHLINYVFRNGAAPDPIEAGDAGCNDTTDLSDAIYIINFAFRNGPAPCCPD